MSPDATASAMRFNPSGLRRGSVDHPAGGDHGVGLYHGILDRLLQHPIRPWTYARCAIVSLSLLALELPAA